MVEAAISYKSQDVISDLSLNPIFNQWESVQMKWTSMIDILWKYCHDFDESFIIAADDTPNVFDIAISP